MLEVQIKGFTPLFAELFYKLFNSSRTVENQAWKLHIQENFASSLTG